jgi:hypothetical protein
MHPGAELYFRISSWIVYLYIKINAFPLLLMRLAIDYHLSCNLRVYVIRVLFLPPLLFADSPAWAGNINTCFGRGAWIYR